MMGEAVVFVLAGQNTTVHAHYRAPWEGVSFGGMTVDNIAPTLDVDTASLPAGVEEGGTVRVRGLPMRITEISADDGGMTRILLAEVRT